MYKSLLSIFVMAAAGLMPAAATTLLEDNRTPDNRVVYEVFTRNFSSTSKLSQVTAQLPRLKELGVDVVWLMPIQKGGDKDRWGTYSSPYAVKNYTLIDPLYGNAANLTDLVTTAHQLGMEVWLDWVANHTSTDNVWTTEHPEYYGSSFKHPMGWSDVYQLDYTNADMRAAMIDAMKYWVTEFDIDGFRCDYADGVPVNFWQEARQAIDAVKPLTWLAESAGEGNNVQLVSKVFDYNYAWAFNTALISAGTNDAIAQKVSDSAYLLHNARDSKQYAGKSRMVYLSNHDVVQDQKGTPDRHFGDNLKPMTVFEFTAYGMPLIYNGQEINWSTGQVLLAEKSVINWNKGDEEITRLFSDLCRLKHSCPALNAGDEGGDYIRHQPQSAADKALVYERRRGTASVVVMLNFSTAEETLTLSTLPSGRYTEYFTGDQVDFTTNHRFTLPAKGYAIWTRDDETPIEDLSYKIYVDDNTGWSDLNIYGWADGNYAEIFGAWPGAKSSATATLSDGITYKVWEVPQKMWGHPYNLIFNRSSSQLSDYNCPLSDDVILKVTATSVSKKASLPELALPDYSDESPWLWHDGAGVEAVLSTEVCDGPIEYYTLQGIKVEHPGSGFFIRRQGSRSAVVRL